MDPPILKRSLPDMTSEDEPQAKRQKSSEPPSALKSVCDKVAAEAYESLQDMADDVLLAVKAALSAVQSESSDGTVEAASNDMATRTKVFKDKATDIFRRERAYPRSVSALSGNKDAEDLSVKGDLVLSLVGYAPQERRLFSSLPLSRSSTWAEGNLPAGVSISRVVPSAPQEKTQTLGELYSPPRNLPTLQPPKQPKTQAKGNTLDFYHPEPADTSQHRGNSYFSAKLPAGHYLDYSNATPSWQTKTKKHERAQSLAGKKPSSSEAETSEMESLFRGAFSTFAPCKDDSASLVPSSLAGKIWWQQAGQKTFQRMIEIEYYEDVGDAEPMDKDLTVEDLDEGAIREAIDNWDDSVVDPTLEEVMDSKGHSRDKDFEEILDEVSDMIETLASYQRIRNLTLPNSQNRQSSDPVNGDMLATSGPQPSEEEQATYQVLRAQLALIVKTLPPYAVAKLNGDQLDELLVSTKVQVQTDQYNGVMEEDEAGVQARIKAQQQAAAAAAAAQPTPRAPAQRTPSVSSLPYANQYPAGNQYGTPNRTPAHPQQYYRPQMQTPNYQQQRTVSQPASFQSRPQPNQYSRPNGYPNQYATQLAKAQTPYGHQNMQQQYAGQQRPPQYGQLAQQANPAARYPYQPGFPQQPSTPTPANFSPYTNGTNGPQRTMSPQVQPNRQAYSPSPNMQQNQRYGTPNQPMNQVNRFPSQSGQSNPGLTGYHTVIPEAQQQRIIDQAKARVAAQERSASFTDKISQPGLSGLSGMGFGGSVDASRLAAARSSLSNQPQTPTGLRQGSNGTPASQHIPLKVTPVPLPAVPGSQPQQNSPS